MERAGTERGGLRLALPLWLIGAVALLAGILRGRLLVVLAGAAAIAYDAGGVRRFVRTIRALTRRTHDDAAT